MDRPAVVYRSTQRVKAVEMTPEALGRLMDKPPVWVVAHRHEGVMLKCAVRGMCVDLFLGRWLVEDEADGARWSMTGEEFRAAFTPTPEEA